MKAIYIGPSGIGQSFFTTKSNERITGFSRSVDVGDWLIGDTGLVEVYEVMELIRRDYNGVFDNPADAKNNFFDAKVCPIIMNKDERIKFVNENSDMIKNSYRV